MKNLSTFFKVTKPIFSVKILFILFLGLWSANAFGQVDIIPANGTINSCVVPTNYTTLGDIILDENNDDDFRFANKGNFTLIITAPTNFEFKAGSGTVVFKPGADITAAAIVITTTSITVTYQSDQGNRINGGDLLTISGIQFRGINIVPSSGPMIRVAGAAGGTGIIIGAGNGAIFGTLTSTNNPIPANGGGAAAICVGSTTTFTNSTLGGSWSIIPVTGTATITAGGMVTGTSAGTVTVVYTKNGCVANSNLTINPLPNATTVAGGGTFCNSTTITASGGSGGTIYFQGIASGGTSTATASSSQSVNVSGTYYFRSRSALGCWGTEGSVTVVVNQPPGAIAGATRVCSGASTTYTNPVAGGIWSVINDPGTNASINSATGVLSGGANAGTATVVYTIGSCTSATFNITVNDVPLIDNQPVATIICTTKSGNFSVSATGATTYQWRKDGVILTNVSPYSGVNTPTLTITNPTVATAGNFDVIVSNANCSVISIAKALTVTTVPTATASVPVPNNNATGVCYAGTGFISSVSWNSAAGATSYDVYFGADSLPGTFTNVTTNSFGVGTLLPNTIYYWKIIPRNDCGTTTGTPIVWNFKTSAVPCYCISISSGNTGRITNFSTSGGITNISNPSAYSAGGYGNFTAQSVSQYLTGSVSFSAVLNNIGSGVGFGVWVDWNQDGDFADAGEAVYNSAGYLYENPTAISFSVPAGAVLGNTRMRIVSNYFSGMPSACNPSMTSGETEDYTFVTVAIPACSGTPNAGNINVNPASGSSGSNYDVASSGYSIATGLTFQWQYSDTGGSPWTNEGSATSSYAALTGMVAPAFGVVRTWQLVVACSSSGLSGYSTGTFTSGYCIPSVSVNRENTYYITTVNFIGNITNSDNSPTPVYSASPRGYQDWTTLGTRASQAQGEGVNIFVDTAGGASYMKAWVDWNKDGVFDTVTEVVYQCTNGFINTTFGFKIPDSALPGDYRIRLRINQGNSYGPCENLNNYGETEDYLFTVVANCAAKITSITNGSTCGEDVVVLNAVGSAGTIEYRWYTMPVGGTYTSSSTSSWTTPSISATTTYYVTAYNGTCESLFRTAVIATVKKLPTLTFSNPNPEICGDASIINLAASGSNEQIFLVDENFEGATISFTNNQIKSPNGAITNWQIKPSTYVPAYPTYPVWYPAISSGFGSNKFIMSTSDLTAGGTTSGKVEEALELTTAVNTIGFLNLTMTFRMYFSSYYDSNNANTEGVFIETNSGTGWSPAPITSYLGDEGIGTSFVTKTINMNGLINVNSLKIRIRYRAGWCDGVALDDIKLFGDKPLTPSFNWTSSTPIDFYSDPAATIIYTPGTPATDVYIKASAFQMETQSSWGVVATATLANGCAASGNIAITNNNKIWNTTTTTDWNSTNKWLPNNSVPDATQCVIIKQPVVLGTGAAGLAKNITVQPGGSLTINPNQSLTVTDEIINNAGAANVVVANDANLLQTTDAAVNTGGITVKRNANLKRLDYNYWASPVTGQNMKAFSPGTLNSRFYTYNESNDLFDVIDPVANNFANNGKGYAIRASNTYGTTLQVFNGSFVGVPNNGITSVGLNYTDPTHGFNLVGNPYSSNIDFYTLHANNSALIYNTAYFWTNINPNPAMQGSGYPGSGFLNNYAVLNGTGGVGATSTAPVGGDIPNQYIKVGQGFIVKAKAAGNLSFKNAVRTNNSSSIFFNKNGQSADRYWLNLTTPLEVMTTQLIGYKEEATNGFEFDYDAPLIVLGADAFYSILDDKRLAIQGKAPFVNTDVVPLGSSHYGTGNYTISLGTKEGIFANGQTIYLKDKLTSTVTNLSEGNYTFTANQGLTDGRFEIIYQPEVVLGTGAVLKENLVVYRDGNDFVVKSSIKKITGIQVYDTSGRLMMKASPNQNEIRLDGNTWINGIYILKINQNGEITSKKVMR